MPLKSIRLILCIVGCSIIPTGTATAHSGFLDPDGGHFDRASGDYHSHRQRTSSRLPAPPIDPKLKVNTKSLKMGECFEVKAEKANSLRTYSNYETDSQPTNIQKNTKFKVIRTATVSRERWYGIRIYTVKPNSRPKASRQIAYVREVDWYKFKGTVRKLDEDECKCFWEGEMETILITGA